MIQKTLVYIGTMDCQLFKDNGLDVIIEYNMKIVNYLDVTVNLNDSI